MLVLPGAIGQIGRTRRSAAAPASGYDVFVLAGQSNMIGRYGPIDGVLDATDADIMQWGYNAQVAALASDPLDHDGETANTIGMGLSFAKAYKAAGLLGAGRKILLVPVAKGGTAIAYWGSGQAGNTAVISSVNAAMAAGTGTNYLKGILWHQGESDGGRSTASYSADLDSLISRWRSSFTGGSASTPFIAGELLQGGSQTDANIVTALTQTPDRNAYAAFASATGLSSGGDNLHFSASSQRTFGARYFTGYQAALTNAATVPDAVSTLSGAVGNNQITLSWIAPSTGHSAITDYIVEYKLSASGTWLTFADGTSAATGAVVTGLTNGSSYDFRVAPVNAIGQGAYSNVETKTPLSSGVEAGAARHWLLGSDNPTNGDLVVGDVLTPVSTPLSQSTGFVTTQGQNGGARSTKTSAGPKTIIVVARGKGTANGFVCGSLGLSAGASIYTQSGVFQIRARPTNDVTGRSVDASTWFFLAMSYSNGSSRLDYIAHPTTPFVGTPGTDSSAVGTNLLGIGDTYYNDAGFAAQFDIAEFIIFDAVKTQAEIEAIYARTKTRLEARGITVYGP